MNRKDFLSSIPLLSAIPFLSTKVERKDGNIILLDPKPIEVPKTPIKQQHFRGEFEMQILWNGCVVGTSYTEWNINHEGIYEDGYFGRSILARDQFQASARFDWKEILDNIEKIQNAKW